MRSRRQRSRSPEVAAARGLVNAPINRVGTAVYAGAGALSRPACSMRYAVPIMVAGGGGSIINTASIAAMVAFPALSPYCASKGGVVMMTRTVAAEYAAAGIRANCICPGVTNTPLVAEMSVTSPEIIEGVKTMTPMGRVAQPMEMGKVAAFLAGPDSAFITGQAIAVDGGYTVL